MHGTAMMDLHKCRIGVVPDNERERPPTPPPLPAVVLERWGNFSKGLPQGFFVAAASKLGRFCSLRSVKIDSHDDPVWLTVSMCCRVGSLTEQKFFKGFKS